MAAWALGQIDDPRSIDPLSYASVKDADYDVREEAKNSLEKLGVQAD
jgi:HEAT repeat protein